VLQAFGPYRPGQEVEGVAVEGLGRQRGVGGYADGRLVRVAALQQRQGGGALQPHVDDAQRGLADVEQLGQRVRRGRHAHHRPMGPQQADQGGQFVQPVVVFMGQHGRDARRRGRRRQVRHTGWVSA